MNYEGLIEHENIILGEDECQITSQALPCVGGEVVVVAVGSWGGKSITFSVLHKDRIFSFLIHSRVRQV